MLFAITGFICVLMAGDITDLLTWIPDFWLNSLPLRICLSLQILPIQIPYCLYITDLIFLFKLNSTFIYKNNSDM